MAIIKITFYFLIFFGIASCDNPSSLPQITQKTDKNVEQQQKPLLSQVSQLEKSLVKNQDEVAILSIKLDEKLLDISKQKETISTLQADKQDLKSQLAESRAEIKTLEAALTTVETDCKAKVEEQ
jgi:septal ring factor EnvC (AmiA/AmiB activator)